MHVLIEHDTAFQDLSCPCSGDLIRNCQPFIKPPPLSGGRPFQILFLCEISRFYLLLTEGVARIEKVIDQRVCAAPLCLSCSLVTPKVERTFAGIITYKRVFLGSDFLAINKELAVTVNSGFPDDSHHRPDFAFKLVWRRAMGRLLIAHNEVLAFITLRLPPS